MRIIFGILLFGLIGCTSSNDMISVRYDYLLNDGNSKVWMIDQMIIDKTNISSQYDHQKELLIFYQSGNFQYIPLQELGHRKGRIGSYFLDSEERKLKLHFKNEIWHFKLDELSEDSIYLTPLKDSKVDFSMQLVPLREIFFENNP